jgi:rare lipoprotein A
MPPIAFAATTICLASCLSLAPRALAGQDSQGGQRGDASHAAHAHAGPANKPSHARKLDRTGEPRVGKASVYARKFAGRRMANGRRMDPHDGNAASKTLPLGTKARVTNLETGKSAVVTIEDRGPHVPGRIVDLSPSTAQQIGVTRRQGVAPVEVAPIAVPPAQEPARAVAAAK